MKAVFAGRRQRHRGQSWLWFILALLAAAIFAFPIFFMLSTSFKAEAKSSRCQSAGYRTSSRCSGTSAGLQFAPVARFFLNSAVISVLDVTFTVFFCALAGYGFAKFRFPGRRLLFYLVISTMMVPFQILLVPLFVQMRAFHWDNTYLGLIVPGLLNAFGVFTMRQMAYSIPDELLEAARIDGASEPRIFWQIVFPLLGPARQGSPSSSSSGPGTTSFGLSSSFRNRNSPFSRLG